MNNKLFIPLILILVLFFNNINAQDENKTKVDTSKYHQKIDVEDFDSELLSKLIINKVNKYRLKAELDSIVYDITLTNAADDQSEFMARQEMVTEKGRGRKKTLGKRIMYYGGSNYGYELVGKISPKKGKEKYTYDEVAENIVFKYVKNKKKSQIINNPLFIFIGVGCTLDFEKKKIYTSIVFGNYKSFNNGANRAKEMNTPFTKKKYGLKPFDDKTCKNCKKYKNIEDLQKGLYIKDDAIYFKSNNLKALKKLLKNPKDGLAVDIIQREQYTCTGDNIIDNNLINKGILTKRVWRKKLLKNNLITDKKERKKKIDVKLAKMPKDIEGDYEFNLVIIQNKHVCRDIPQSYIDDGGVEYNSQIDLLADTVTINSSFVYKPVTEKSNLSFKIPFEKNKSTYNQDDIKPVLSSLKEPNFIINNLVITAYSSIEGNESLNKALQKKRAQSIVDALKGMQKSNLKYKINTADNWEDFKNDVSGTDFENIASMSLNQAQNYIKKNKLSDKLESILANERYAKIEADIIYDIEGDKEQAFVVSRFNKAVKNGDLAKALSIQKYIFKKIIKEEYNITAVSDQEIPETPECAGLLMNKIWLEKYIEEDNLETGNYCETIKKLHKLAPSNDYISFNNVYCNVSNNNCKTEKGIAEQQEEIDALYETSLSKETVDLLNMEFQFKIIEEIDTTDKQSDLLTQSLQKVKDIVNIKESNWQNSLKLAYVFMKHKDYKFAAKLLDPFIYKDNVFEELIFTYISLCSKSQARMYSNKFAYAIKKAHEINPSRLCELFAGKKLPMQVIENKLVKKEYCNYCNK